ncbi:MAG: Ribosomal RNA small subunit methyltransferase I [Bacteroidia bacterium]|nr:Ribosomal RNA small subunit methyltransferase I [Bacteroidia bacterium]
MQENNPVNGLLFLIPTPLGEEIEFGNFFPTYNSEIVNSIDVFIAEDAKSARRFLKQMGFKKSFDEITIHLLNEHSKDTDARNYLDVAMKGKNIGLLSDAGCPGIADPGASVIKMAHENNIQVVPLVGPSSILLALISSGMNGQNFAFNGYLQRETPLLTRQLRELEKRALQQNQTQVFIETPYRNTKMLETILQACGNETRLCIACDITLATEFIKTKTIAVWKKNLPDIHKRPAVFVLGR